MIPAEAVEAAARAMNPRAWGPQVWTFQAHGEAPTEARNRVQQEALQQARAALEAAAPHMLAAAWEEGKNAVWTFMSNQDPLRERPANPYRINTEGEK